MSGNMIWLLSLCVVFVSAQTTPKPRPTPRPPPDFVTVLKYRGKYDQAIRLLREADLLDQLLAAPTLTLFLPTDDAISKNAATINALRSKPDELKRLLEYHAVTSEAYRFHGNPQDKVLYSSNARKVVRLNNYRIGYMGFSTAEGVRIGDHDIHVYNGYVHGIEGIMTPPEGGDIVDLITRRQDMTTLADLLVKSGMDYVIRADHNITVFAPNDTAFAKLDPEILKYFLRSPEYLKDTLLFHVINYQTMWSIGMRHSMTFQTGDKERDRVVLLEDAAGGIHINNAAVTEKDVGADNGVMHVIDEVLIPTRVLLDIEAEGYEVVG